MKNTLVIAQRELIEKRFVFVAAGAFLILALLVPFMPGIRTGDRAGAIVMGSMVLAMGFTYGLSLILGASIVGRELADGRLSFYFSKPVPATSVWWGKLTAAVALLVACFVIIATPAFVVGRAMVTILRWASTPADMVSTAGYVLAIALGLFLVSHVAATFIRSRSAWVLFDFAAAAVCIYVISILTRQLLRGYAFHLAHMAGIVIAVLFAAAMIGGGAWQLARGRTDRKRSHIELSRFLWITIGSVMLIAAGFVWWVASPRLSDVRNAMFAQADNGSWGVITGRVGRDDYQASFLYNISDRRTIRVPAVHPALFRFSGDGNTAAWMLNDGVYVTRLDAANPQPVRTRITGDGFVGLSADGARAIIRSGPVVTTYDLLSERSLGSVRSAPETIWPKYRPFKTPQPMICAANHNGPLLLCRTRTALIVWNTMTGQTQPITR